MAILTDWTSWLIVGFVLLILELILPGVFLMWWGLAAVIVGTVSAFIDIPNGWQIVLFAVLAIVFSLIWWKYQYGKDVQEDEHNKLNARNHHLIGAIGTVDEITKDNIIRGKFGDTTWKIIGSDLQIGDKVEVQNVEGITLFVRKRT